MNLRGRRQGVSGRCSMLLATPLVRLYLHRAMLAAIDAARKPAELDLPATAGRDDGR